MDGNRFDDALRALIASPSRRGVLGISLAGALGTLLGPVAAEAKKKGKNKKKCKGKKKCGKKCIPKTSCCPACTDGKVCTGGACACPQGTFPCGNTCVAGDQCCTNSDCDNPFICEDGFCICDAIACDSACCDPAEDEVCKVPAQVCQGGGCPVTDFCEDPNLYVCEADGCACVTSINSASACTDFAVAECIECASDASCVMSLGQPAVCIPQGEFCVGICPDIVTGFCVPIGCSSSPLSAGGRGRGRGGRLTFSK